MATKHPRVITGLSGGRRAAAGRSLVEQVYDALKRDVVTGVLKPSETINEPGLAARYGISKTPVREALRLMVQDGWIVVLPRKGYLVRPLALNDVREIFALRRMLEPPLAGDAARRATQTDVARLREILARQSSAELDFEEVIDAARDFHVAIAELSGNTRAVNLVSNLTDEVVRLMHLMPRLEDNLRSVAELEAHDAITEAIALGSSDEAADLMRAHLVVAGGGMTRVFGDDS